MTKNLLRHIVLFKFKESASSADIKRIENAFSALPSTISLIKDFECGVNISPENLSHGFTHCFLLSFLNEKDRDDYLVHPDHKAFGSLLRPFLDKALVTDFMPAK